MRRAMNSTDPRDVLGKQVQRVGADGIPHAVAVAELQGSTRPRAWREHKGLTLQALADAAGLSKAYVSQIEGGKRIGTAATLKKLAAALNVPVDALMP
jgi:DNA-binding XRE family transcriptional regulator